MNADSGRRFDLEERLLEFAARVVRLTQGFEGSYAHRHVAQQLLRSATSPLAHHGEAQSAESNADFIHKMKVALKEFRESHRWLKLIERVPLLDNSSELSWLLDENDQLERIFNSSIKTVRKRLANPV